MSTQEIKQVLEAKIQKAKENRQKIESNYARNTCDSKLSAYNEILKLLEG